MTEPIFDHDRLDVYRLSAMLTRMALKFESVSESRGAYTVGTDYEHEHRFAEHEHEEDAEPEQRNAPKDTAQTYFKSMSTAHPR